MKNNSSSSGSELSKPLLKRLTDFMWKKLDSPIYVEDMASKSNMSTFHFARSFKKSTGHSPHQYLTTMRLEKSVTLLTAGVRIADVASASGFSDQAHYTRVFKKHYNVTPAAYRRKMKKESQAS